MYIEVEVDEYDIWNEMDDNDKSSLAWEFVVDESYAMRSIQDVLDKFQFTKDEIKDFVEFNQESNK